MKIHTHTQDNNKNTNINCFYKSIYIYILDILYKNTEEKKTTLINVFKNTTKKK